MLQHVAELGVDLCAISEPAHFPDSYRWYSSLNDLAAIYISDRNTTPNTSLICRNANFVAISFNDLYIVSVYISPNVSLVDYSAFLDDLTDFCVQWSRNLIICGDFNAHAISWGSPSTDSRGHLVEEWAASSASQRDMRRMIPDRDSLSVALWLSVMYMHFVSILFGMLGMLLYLIVFSLFMFSRLRTHFMVLQL